MSFYDALANNEPAVKELTDEALKKLAHELTENLRKNLSVDWSERESVRASLRLMVKRILRKCKYPPDMQEAAVELVLQQAQTLGDSWMRRAGSLGHRVQFALDRLNGWSSARCSPRLTGRKLSAWFTSVRRSGQCDACCSCRRWPALTVGAGFH